ncbi:hypothetical protein [Clostridium tetani]|uniref:hypothetical protein n=1 Tax=Clostridium tetani TaxID=1513 RepID=UPI000512EE52|nr:hypothetical protein [Clostridium tetani]KGI43906.1 hypothetical protein KY55_05705 [Clostridium tetani]RXI68170.1 hypothetical protein DP127_12865 [Clostridium tetani]BDR75750.1 hypothetical protein K154306013_14100 [Clostridium tetani]BDR86866.1 hypothetical protein N071400001_14740 [Clostridium tetani]
MKRGSLIIYDNEGKVWVNTGDAEGDILPHTLPSGLPYIITEYGQLEGKIVKGVNVETKELILEDIPKVETEEERLRREKEELENQLLLQADNNLDGGIL